MKESNDILAMFEVLSNHEVFTPPRIARQMLDLLPQEVWSHPEYRFLDPATKSGIFLREIFFRLFEGLKGKGHHLGHDGLTYDLNDPKQRTNHILKNMVFGIATSELTAYLARRTLYGVMKANSSKRNAGLVSLEKAYGKGSIPADVLARFFQEDTVSEHGRDAVVFNDYYDPQIFSSAEYRGLEDEGNIFYPTEEVQTRFEDGDYEVEDSYFPFIEERTVHSKILAIKDGKMKFDVIIGNPPYQLKDGEGGNGSSAQPIYQSFVESAMRLQPRYLSMIIPSRWFAGGKGLDEFRSLMLKDRRIEKLVDHINASDCFSGIELKGGVCYFLWNRDRPQKEPQSSCEIKVVNGNKIEESARALDEYDVFVRFSTANSILRKVKTKNEPTFDTRVSSRKPFGLESSFKEFSKTQQEGFIKIYAEKQTGFVNGKLVPRGSEMIPFYKVLLSKAYGAGEGFPHQIIGKPFVTETNSCCTETYLVCGISDSRDVAENIASYMETKFFRMLTSLRKITQNISKDKFSFVPDLDFSRRWSDAELYERYSLSENEIAFIESIVKPFGGVSS